MDRADLAALLPAEVPGLLRYARTLTPDEHSAEDLVGDTVVRALERVDSFRGDARLATWLHRILHNLAVDRARGRREVPADDMASVVEAAWRDDAYTVDAEVVASRSETAEELRDALIRLPHTYRAAVVLHDAEGWKAAQIADMFDIGLPAAKQRIRRGRMMLVSALAQGAERREMLRGVPLRCWEARSRVSDYLDDELTESERGLLEHHLAGCPTCPALYTSLVAARSALAGPAGDGRRDPDSTVPPAIAARIQATA